jgi:hypothetical protein
MAITSFSQYVGAFKQHIQIAKTNTVTTVAGQWSTVFDRAGFPAAGALSPGNTTNGVVPTDATTGFPTIATFAGSNKGYLSRVEAFSNVAGTLALFDVLFWAGATTIPTSGTTTVALTSRPSFTGRLPFDSGGSNPDYTETELWVWLSTAGGNQAHTVSIDYTDQGGTTAQNTGNVSTQSIIVNRMLRMPWASGDYGTRDLEGYKVNGVASATGAVVAMVLRRLWAGRVNANNYVTFGPDLTGMPQVFDTSALMCACLMDSTTSATMSIIAEIAEG